MDYRSANFESVPESVGWYESYAFFALAFIGGHFVALVLLRPYRRSAMNFAEGFPLLLHGGLFLASPGAPLSGPETSPAAFVFLLLLLIFAVLALMARLVAVLVRQDELLEIDVAPIISNTAGSSPFHVGTTTPQRCDRTYSM